MHATRGPPLFAAFRVHFVEAPRAGPVALRMLIDLPSGPPGEPTLPRRSPSRGDRDRTKTSLRLPLPSSLAYLATASRSPGDGDLDHDDSDLDPPLSNLMVRPPKSRLLSCGADLAKPGEMPADIASKPTCNRDLDCTTTLLPHHRAIVLGVIDSSALDRFSQSFPRPFSFAPTGTRLALPVL